MLKQEVTVFDPRNSLKYLLEPLCDLILIDVNKDIQIQ